MAPVFVTAFSPMQLITLLNHCQRFPGFVYEKARLCAASNTIEVKADEAKNENARHSCDSRVISADFANRNTPTAMYMAYSPAFGFDKEEELFVGGSLSTGAPPRSKNRPSSPS